MKAFIAFASYVWITTLAGLAIHPYQSVRRMVMERERRILLPVALSPTLALAGFFLVGRMGSYVIDVGGRWRELMALLLGWTFIGLLLWQVLILVLILRFVRSLLIRE